MFDWVIQNLGTIAVGLTVAGIIAAIIVKIVRDKRKGKCVGCDGGCAGCPSSRSCSYSRGTE
jgi:hypothetical protein